MCERVSVRLRYICVRIWCFVATETAVAAALNGYVEEAKRAFPITSDNDKIKPRNDANQLGLHLLLLLLL